MELDEVVEARGARFSVRAAMTRRIAPSSTPFIENFRVEEELGAGCSVVRDGRTVADLWGWLRLAPISRNPGTRTALSA